MNKKQRRRFKIANPVCIFCGGFGPNETIEHCPPQSLFLFNEWPDGFSFSACKLCNNGTSDYDLLVTMLARSGAFSATGDADEKMEGLLRRANRRYPGIIERMIAPVRAAKAAPAGSEVNVVQTNGLQLTEEHHTAMRIFAGKLAKSAYYKQAGHVFPHTGSIVYTWQSNVELFNRGSFTLLEGLESIGGVRHAMKSGDKQLDDQFELEIAIAGSLMAATARFTTAFVMVIFASTQQEQLESTLDQIEQATGRPQPFTWVQWCPVATP
jgi:hypothetical protein